MHEVDQRCIME